MSSATFTLQPLTKLAGPALLPPDRAIDVGTFKTVNVQLFAPLAPTSGSVDIILEHAMIRDEAAFQSTGLVFTVSSNTTVLTLIVTNPNRYLRWRAATNTGSPFPVQIMLECLGRDT